MLGRRQEDNATQPFFDKLDAGIFQGSPDRAQVIADGLSGATLEISECRPSNAGG